MHGRYRMNSVLLAALFGLVGALANREPCSSGQNTTSGECCMQCPPGEGVVQSCGASQTTCSPCIDSETFSENFSHTEECHPCTRCTGLLRMETPCTDSNDAICVCNYGYFLNDTTQQCQQCYKCPEGKGMLFSCESNQDTICEECTLDTYSDQESSREPCIPCASCDEEEEVLEECTPVRDTVCQGPVTPSSSLGYPSVTYPDFTPDEPPPDSSTTTASGDSQERLYQGINFKLIPIYCSILAAVVVSLVAFIIFKRPSLRWNSCKQNKQGANNCTANQNQTPSPEGEKLHSDSGISVDSPSLHEQQQGQTQAQTVVNMDEEPCLMLPLHAREKVEKLLFRAGEGDDCNHMEDSDWCNLAGLLGYEEERIAAFGQEEHPVRALLSDWASKDCASMEALCKALRKINRDDIAQSLSPGVAKPTATSVV